MIWFLVIGFIVIAAIAFLFFQRSELKLEQVAVTPFVPNLRNDKVVIVRGWNDEELRKIIADFIETYKNDGYASYKIENQKQNENFYRLNFPQDIHPLLFTFLVNFLAYPFELDFKNRSIIVGGKTTLDSGFAGIDESLTGQKAILYLPENDQDFTVVYMRTDSGVYFANSFNELSWKKAQDARLSDETRKLLEGVSF
ncbi:MAG: hypothetical protein M3367_00865 [Acidobacteriota bacterium]|nr:hypothetical protein [Acidobacteriota bacterium]